MQLTMPILADGLAGYRLETTLAPESAELAGIRLGAGKAGDSYVYLTQDGDDVICCSGSECIRVLSAAVGAVFNTISSLTERLQAWEENLDNLIYNSGTLYDLIACSSPILGNPIFILDEREIVFAMTDHPVGTVDPEWDHMIQYGRMPYNRIRAIYHDTDYKTIHRSSESKNQVFIFQPPGMTHRGINFRIPDPSADSFLGTLVVVESHTPFTAGAFHLTRILARAIVKWTRIHEKDHNMKNISHLFADLLDGIRVEEDEIVMTRSLYNMDDDLFVLAVIPPEGQRHLPSLAPALESEAGRGISFHYRSFLLMVCAVDPDEQAFRNRLQNLAEDLQIRIGISYPFSDWRAMKSAFKQANIALSHSPDRLSMLSPDSAMRYLVSELSVTLHGSNILHPAIITLDKHDSEHGTQYYNTLYEYLRNERNLVRTAAALFIHRNSLVYRIARIQELININLDDYAVRHYLLLSFQCQEATRPPLQT